jgi:hypothetical protein
MLKHVHRVFPSRARSGTEVEERLKFRLNFRAFQGAFVIVTDEDLLEAGLVYPPYSRLRLNEVVAAILLAGDLEGAVPPKGALLDKPTGNGGDEQKDFVADVE